MILLNIFLLSLAFRSPPSMMTAADNLEHRLPNVIVVGAGLAGLATSLGLANTGRYTVDLVEQRLNFDRKGATFGLAPNGIKALDELDPEVMPALSPLGIDISQGYFRGYMLAWWMVRDALLERVLSKSDKIRLHLGYSVETIVDEPSIPQVQATFVPSIKTQREEATTKNDAVPSKRLTLEGCLLVGADGLHSTVRDCLKRPPAQSVGATLWRGSVSLDTTNPEAPDYELHQRLAPLLEKGIVAWSCNASPTLMNVYNFHSKVPGRMAWTIVSKVPDIPPNSHVWDTALEAYVENDEDRKIIQALLSLSNPDDVNCPTSYCTIELPAQDGNGWGGDRRTILIGDAAHAMRGASGQGGSMAFEDSVVLCRALKQLPTSSTTSFEQVSDLVLRVENERLPRVRTIWNTEQIVAEQNYLKGQTVTNPMTSEYCKWLYQGL